MIARIDHVSIVVKNYDNALNFFQNILGGIPGAQGVERDQEYLWKILSLGDLSRIELLTPTGKRSFLEKFLENRDNGGVHHINIQTPDIYRAREILERHHIPYFDFHDSGPSWKELFIHPRDAFGVLIQIAEFPPDLFLHDSVKLAGKRKWSVSQSENGCTVRFVHPGGGTAAIALTKAEVRALASDLNQIL
ncbi:MAG: VOC family protein [Deltaproteobacteria bacterium]|nr:VOC family protein [Deltaproteobacteria bacterium]